MNYVLDTDTLIYFLKGQTNVVNRLSNVAPEDIATTIINYSELLFGAYHSARKKQNLETVQAFLTKMDVLEFCKESSY